MTESALLGLAGLSIGAAVVTGLALFAMPVAEEPVQTTKTEHTMVEDTPVSLAGVPHPLTKPEQRPSKLAATPPAKPTPAQPTLARAVDPAPVAPKAQATPVKTIASISSGPEVTARDEARRPVRARYAALTPPPSAPGMLRTETDAGDWPQAPDRTADAPAWRRFAALAPASDGRPRIVVVLDDMGLSEYRSDRAVALPRPLTMAILPYGPEPGALVARARAAGHEVLVHLPMEPRSSEKDPGPNALRTGLTAEELDRRIAHNLERMNGYVGINNHMGSRFTASARDMDRLMTVLRKRGLLFLDSLTTGASVGRRLAVKHGVPSAARDIFLDNSRTPADILRQLARVEEQARENGYAIAIGHPYPETLDALSQWLPSLKAKGFVLAPISAVVAHRLTG